MENKKLIKKLKKGEEAAFKEVYFKYYDRLLSIAKRFNFKFLTPDDFVQESFLRLYNKRKLLKDEVLFDKQLFVICKNIIINHINRERKVIPLDPLKIEIEEEEFELESLENQRIKLYFLLDQLPEQQQKIFTLHKLDNLTYQEIAAITNLSQKTIANHIYLANKFIRKKIAGS